MLPDKPVRSSDPKLVRTCGIADMVTNNSGGHDQPDVTKSANNCAGCGGWWVIPGKSTNLRRITLTGSSG